MTQWKKPLILWMLQQKLHHVLLTSPQRDLLVRSSWTPLVASVFGFLPVSEDVDESVSLRITTPRPLLNKQLHLKNLTPPPGIKIYSMFINKTKPNKQTKTLTRP